MSLEVSIDQRAASTGPTRPSAANPPAAATTTNTNTLKRPDPTPEQRSPGNVLNDIDDRLPPETPRKHNRHLNLAAVRKPLTDGYQPNPRYPQVVRYRAVGLRPLRARGVSGACRASGQATPPTQPIREHTDRPGSPTRGAKR
jgi:hypothetical protein